MWDMIDDASSSIGSGFRYLRELSDRALMIESAKTSATEYTLKQKDVQAKILVEVKKEVLKEFGVKDKRTNIIDFTEIAQEVENV